MHMQQIGAQNLMNEFLQLALEAAAEAAQIIREGAAKPKKIEYKGDVDLVTETDKRSEAAIVARIRKKYPDHAIVAEEGSEGAPRGAKYCWYIDPLDGTTNFAHGYPCFAASIALLENDVPLVGVVANPMLDETFSAARGEGAFLNGKPIHVSPTPKLAASLVATGFPTHLLHKKGGNIEFYWGFTLRSHGVRRDGSAALDMCTVACGRFEGYWEFGLNSWDTAAGTLIVREAGGKVTSLEGEEYRAGGPTILATNGLVHNEMRDLAAEISLKAAARQQAG
jgi:myo-inositol-1(or 4)-monophosphatase